MRGGVKMGFSFLRRIGNLSGPVYASGDILFAAVDKKYVAGGEQADSPANLQPNTAPRAAKKRRTPEGVRHFNIHDASFQ
ncbi:MAG: hypothetical protein V8S81_09195 [Oscillospiraceae bacterium]